MRRIVLAMVMVVGGCVEQPVTDTEEAALTGATTEVEVEADSIAPARKVTICHIPPGNPDAMNTLSVGEPSLSAHLAHGDLVGDCRSLFQVCEPDSIASCYSGPAGTAGVGACRAGTQRCDCGGMSYDTCRAEVLPRTEVCGNRIDDDCDGSTDEGCTVANAVIGDRVWLDTSRDGIQDPGEPGIGGVTVRLLTGTGTLVATTTTNTTGAFQFSVPAGSYYVQVVASGLYRFSPPDMTGDAADSDFGADGLSPLTAFTGANSSIDAGLLRVATKLGR